MVQNTKVNLWVGANDLSKEGDFRLINGMKFEVDSDSLYGWDGAPNDDHGEDCVHIYYQGGYNDADCDDDSNDGRDIHGLCEIKTPANCITK